MRCGVLLVRTIPWIKLSTVGFTATNAAVIWVSDNATPCPGSANPKLLGPDLLQEQTGEAFLRAHEEPANIAEGERRKQSGRRRMVNRRRSG